MSKAGKQLIEAAKEAVAIARGKKAPARIARLRIELDEVKPRVVRRIEVPLAMRLDDLHLAFQIAMGWENDHLYEFQAGRAAWGIPDPEVPRSAWDILAASEAVLADLLAQAPRKSFNYLYDFGDGWSHSVSVEAVTEAASETGYPRLLDAEGRCPPEDCGGPYGYTRYLEAIGNRKHKRHKEMIEWRGPGFDPTALNAAAIRKELAALAKRIARPRAERAKES